MMGFPDKNVLRWLVLSGCALLILVVLILPVWGQSGGDFEIAKATFAGSGGAGSGTGYELLGTAGQPTVGGMSGGGYVLSGGYWSPGCAAAQVTAVLNAGVQFTWPGGSTYDLFRAVDDPYANDGSQIGFAESSGWTYAETALGDPAQNAYYLVGAADGCDDRVGEFDFGLVPGE